MPLRMSVKRRMTKRPRHPSWSISQRPTHIAAHCVAGGSTLGIKEVETAARLVREAAHPEANIIFGTVIDDALGDEMRITVIAAGFDGGAPPFRAHVGALGSVDGATAAPASPELTPVDAPIERDVLRNPLIEEPVARTDAIETRPVFDAAEALDIPDFLK